MKFVLIVVAVVVLLWLLGGLRRRVAPPPAKTSGSSSPQEMVACAQCGVHLPRGESLPGRGGVFCGEAHRAAFEKEHPGS
jgi:uncharacterized protein